MSFKEPLSEREKALEEAFFRKRDAELLEAMRRKKEEESDREALALALGTEDSDALNALLNAGFSAETALAVSLVPLVAIGWANGYVEEGEREAILRAANDAGVPRSGPAHDLLIKWLNEPPTEKLLAAWTHCISDRCENATPAEREALRATVMDRARGVAEASGGFLGIGSVSRKEREMMQRLDEAFGI